MKTNKVPTYKVKSVLYAIAAYWNAIAPTQFDLSGPTDASCKRMIFAGNASPTRTRHFEG
jgi:hypothetical protein